MARNVVWGAPGWNYPDGRRWEAITIWFDWASGRFPLGRGDVASAVDWFWYKVQPSWAVRAVYLGDPPPLLPWDYLTVRVGYDLGWYTDPGTGQRPAGLCPGADLTRPRGFNPWHRPTVYVDADSGMFASALAACKTALHEVGHAVGLDEDDDTEGGEAFGPRWLAKFRAGCLRAAAALDAR